MSHALLAPLPYADWKATKTTVQLMCQIVGKIRLGHVPHRSHWWNVTLIPTARGLSTLRMRSGTTFFEIAFDFIDHRLCVTSSTARQAASFGLHDGRSVADFSASLFGILRDMGLDLRIVDKPYGMAVDTPFSRDTEHASYDAVMVRRWWEAVVWSADVFDRYAADYAGKTSPAHLFWHSFDLAMARFSGRLASGERKADPVQQEAYSHEVIAVGFWAGDETTPAPTYYTYTAPEPATLTSMMLEPPPAAWAPSGAGHIGTLPYDTVRESADPAATLLQFTHSAFRAGAQSARWDTTSLVSDFRDRAYRADAHARG